MYTLKPTCIQRAPLLSGRGHQNQDILFRETCIKRSPNFQKVFLRHCGIAICLEQPFLPGNLAILPGTASCERFAINHENDMNKVRMQVNKGGDIRGK